MKLRTLPLILIVMLVASACIKVNMNIEVDDDGSASIDGISAVNAEAFGELAGAFGEGGDDICAQFSADDTGINTDDFQDVEPYDEDGFCGVRFSDSLTAEEVEAQGIPGDDSATIRRDGEGWFFELPFQADDFDTGDIDGLPGADALFGEAEFLVRVKLPGRQVEHNGDSIDGDGFVVWDVDVANPPDRLFLRTEPGDPITSGGGSSVGLILGIIFLVLIGLGIAAYFLMRKGAKTDLATAAPASVPGSGTWSAPETPPVGAGSWGATTTAAEPPPVDVQPNPAPAPTAASGSPTPEEATGAPVWDPNRGSYVQWDPAGGRWLVFDDATQSWSPES